MYCGKASESLIRLTTSIFGKPPQQPFFNWQSGKPFELGTFKITPFLTDHSAFDAHMLLIEVAGKRIMYSGDFRRSEEHTSELQSLMRISYAVSCLKKTNISLHYLHKDASLETTTTSNDQI